jgi:thiaminase
VVWANSTMAAEAQARVQLETEAMRGQLAAAGTSLMSAATSDLNVEASIYNDLMNAQVQQDTALETSISGFANAVAYASIAGAKNATSTAAAGGSH